MAKPIVSFELSSADSIVAGATASVSAIAGCSAGLKNASGIAAVNGGSAASMSTSKLMPACM